MAWTLKSQIEELNQNFSDQAKQLEQLQAKADLSMVSIGKVQQEQNNHTRALKGGPPPQLSIPSQAGVLGANPFGSFPPPPPPPPPPKVTILSPSPSFASDSAGFGSGMGNSQANRPWMPKMEFPKFDGSDVEFG